MGDPDPGVRTVAATYLGIIQDGADAVRPDRGLDGSGGGRAPRAAAALGSFGADAARHPRAAEGGGDKDPDVAREAGVAIVKLQRTPARNSRAARRPALEQAPRVATKSSAVPAARRPAPDPGRPPPFPPNRAVSCFRTAALSSAASGARATTTADGAGRRRGLRHGRARRNGATQSSSGRSRPSPRARRRRRSAAARLGAAGQRRGLEGRQPRLRVLELPLRVLDVRLQPLDPGRQVRRAAPTAGGRSTPPRPAAAIAAQRAHAAEELDAGAAPEPFGPGDRNHADRAGARHVRAAARGEVEVLHVDQPQPAGRGPAPSAAEASRPRRRRRTDRRPAGLPRRSGSPRPRRGRCRQPTGRGQIDGRRRGAEVEALGARASDPVERRRQHVLPGVLLHVIEAPRPVDPPADRSPRRRSRRPRAGRAVVVDRRRRRRPRRRAVPVSNGCPPEVG